MAVLKGLADMAGRNPIDHRLGKLGNRRRREPRPDCLIQVAQFDVDAAQFFLQLAGDRLREELP